MPTPEISVGFHISIDLIARDDVERELAVLFEAFVPFGMFRDRHGMFEGEVDGRVTLEAMHGGIKTGDLQQSLNDIRIGKGDVLGAFDFPNVQNG